MFQIFKSEERGHTELGWLNSHHSFSFGEYYDPDRLGFRSLRVINDDTVKGGAGFGTHGHRDMEIISYVLSGALKHKDSMGNSAVMKAGDVQRISAGTGIQHSEYNDSSHDPVHFLQIWITPAQRGVKPDYAEKSFAHMPSGIFHLVCSQSGRDDSIGINQDVDLYLAKLELGNQIQYSIKSNRHVWIQIAEGEIDWNGEILKSGDGITVNGISELNLSAKKKSQILLFDLE
jgi:redox-sensitive bicupin YhaK (pirin superfamily)